VTVHSHKPHPSLVLSSPSKIQLLDADFGVETLLKHKSKVGGNLQALSNGLDVLLKNESLLYLDKGHDIYLLNIEDKSAKKVQSHFVK